MNFIFILYLIILLNFFLFFIGIFGLFATRRNMIVIFMSIEIILLSATLNYTFFSVYLDDIVGQIFSFFILTVAASESALGLALLVLHYRHKAVISVDTLSFLKG
jgi:NADH-quinone oxidoreductase subunit K